MSVAIVAKRNFDTHEVLERATFVDCPNAEQRLRKWLAQSEQVWLGMYDDKVACAWGLVPPSLISNRAYLWLLTTDLVEKHKFLFIRHSQVVMEEALKDYDTIIGHVAVGNEAARKWLRWLGAGIGPPENGYSVFKIRRQ